MSAIPYVMQVERLEAVGSIDPECAACRDYFYGAENPLNVMAPRHKASSRCESGKRLHCTCPVCWG